MKKSIPEIPKKKYTLEDFEGRKHASRKRGV